MAEITSLENLTFEEIVAVFVSWGYSQNKAQFFAAICVGEVDGDVIEPPSKSITEESTV